jgi:phosphoglycerate kinase
MKRSVNDIFIDDVSAYKGKRVLVRLDWNVATDENGNPTETERITRTFTLLENLSQTGAITVVMSHLGEKGASLMPIINFVKEKLPFVTAVAGHDFDEIHKVVEAAAPGDVLVLENIRTFDGEMDNSKFLAQRLASLGEVFINDAFSVAHRKQASVATIPHYVLSYAGPLFKQEVTHLKPLLTPELPALFIIGGAKISTKLSLIEHYLEKGAYVFVGGAMVHNILKQLNVEIGQSLYDKDYIVPDSILNHPRLLLPVDVITADGMARDIYDVPKDGMIVDCGKMTVALLTKHIDNAKTIIMNGPVGLYEKGWKYGSEMLISHIGHKQGATTVLGGGDTLSVLEGIKDPRMNFSFVSLAGGAMLTYLEQGTLPGIDVLVEDVTP